MRMEKGKEKKENQRYQDEKKQRYQDEKKVEKRGRTMHRMRGFQLLMWEVIKGFFCPIKFYSLAIN